LPSSKEGRQATLDYYYRAGNYHLFAGKMTKKISPIEEHKQADLILIREKLLGIIRNEYKCDVCKVALREKNPVSKDITDASKLLARMHKALSPEKIQERTPQEKKAPELSPSEKVEVDDLLKNES
jgi:hypothetical protein